MQGLFSKIKDTYNRIFSKKKDENNNQKKDSALKTMVKYGVSQAMPAPVRVAASMIPPKKTSQQQQPQQQQQKNYSENIPASFDRPSQRYSVQQQPQPQAQPTQPQMPLRSGMEEARQRAQSNQVKQMQQMPTGQAEYEAMMRARDIAQNRAGGIVNDLDTMLGRLENRRGESIRNYESQIPQLQKWLDDYTNRTQQSIGDQENLSRMEQERLARMRGEQERQSIMDEKESNANLQNMFANMGTLDSSKFMQESLRGSRGATARRDEIRARLVEDQQMVESQLNQFRRDAQNQIDSVRNQFTQQMMEIENLKGKVNFDYDSAVQQAITQAQQSVYNIQEGLANTEMQLQRQLAQSQAEAAKQMSQMNEISDDITQYLSEEFLRTGQPQNREDYIYMLQNQKDDKNVLDEEKPALTNTKEGQQALSIIRELKNSNLGPITGNMQIARRLGLKSATDVEQKVKNLVDVLSLLEREKLKGTGTITDNEMNMVRSAITSIVDKDGNVNASEDLLRSELDRLEQMILNSGRNQQIANNQNQMMTSGGYQIVQ